MRALAVEAAGITKRFGPFTALDDVSLKVEAASVHALLGENGAGKSTLVKCLLGYYRADAGGFLVDGQEARIDKPADADVLGLGMVYQHFTLVPSMTVAENLVMSRRDAPAVIDWRPERARIESFVARMPFRIPLDIPVGRLAAGERQKVEILKQLYLERRFLVLDEPTSVLTPQEAEQMLDFVRGLATARELTVVIITHKLKELARIVDTLTVLRRGRAVGGGSARSMSAGAITALMIGETQAPRRAERRGAPLAQSRLTVKQLVTTGDLGRPGLDVDYLDVRAGEIVGVAGVSGNGQKELVEVLGGQREATDGEVLVSGALYGATRAEAQARAVRVLPEEPLRNGCVPRMRVTDNLTLRSFDRDAAGKPRAWLDRRAMAAQAARMIEAFRISALAGGADRRTARRQRAALRAGARA